MRLVRLTFLSPAHEGTRLEAILTWSSPGPRRWRYGAALGVPIRQRIRIERGARAGVRTPPSGRPRGLVRSYYEGLPSMAAFNGCTKLRTGEAKAWPRPKGPKPQSGRMGPRTEIAANWSARWRTRSQGRVPPQGGLKYKDAPFGAPAPHFYGREPLRLQGGKETRACPGLTQKYGRRSVG